MRKSNIFPGGDLGHSLHTPRQADVTGRGPVPRPAAPGLSGAGLPAPAPHACPPTPAPRPRPPHHTLPHGLPEPHPAQTTRAASPRRVGGKGPPQIGGVLVRPPPASTGTQPPSRLSTPWRPGLHTARLDSGSTSPFQSLLQSREGCVPGLAGGRWGERLRPADGGGGDTAPLSCRRRAALPPP